MFDAKALRQLKFLITLIIGFVLGFSVSQLLQSSSCSLDINFPLRVGDLRRFLSYNNELDAVHEKKTLDPVNNPVTSLKIYSNISLSSQLYNEVRVLCWVLTSPKNHATHAIHVKNTWGKRCNKLIFISSANDTELGAVQLAGKEGRGHLWHKTREAAKYIYEHYLDEADWFLKADDDTFVVPENLRVFLHQFSTESPVYFGCKFKPHVRQGYMSGGAGYVLSKEALRRFVQIAYPNSQICRQRMGGSEDIEMGLCLQNVGVIAGDSRDELKRGRFFSSAPHSHLKAKPKTHWYWHYIYYKTEDGLNCCSNYAISFHYIQPMYFYVMEYFIYKLKAFGISSDIEILPAKRNMTELLLKWQNETSDNPL